MVLKLSQNKLVLEVADWVIQHGYINIGNYLNFCSNIEIQQFQNMQYLWLSDRFNYDKNADYIRVVAMLRQAESGNEFEARELVDSCLYFIDLVATEKFIRQARFKNTITEKFHKYATLSDYETFIKDFRTQTKKDN